MGAFDDSVLCVLFTVFFYRKAKNHDGARVQKFES